MPTLNAFDNGDVRTTVIIFSHTQGLDAQPRGGVINTLQARMGTGGNNMPMVYYPIQDGREMNKEQNGLGVGNENDPSYTLDRTGAQSVAYAIQGTVIGRSDTAGPQGKGFGEAGEPMFTIDTVGGHGVATIFSHTQGLDAQPSEEVSPTLRRNGGGMAAEIQTQVRRLTPLECERLQGFPDDWTAGQSDSARYKQMGNAVAVPVVEWLIGNICDTLTQ